MKNKPQPMSWGLHFGGRGEIRTHGGLSSSPVFKTGAFNRSATLPFAIQALDYK